MSIKPMRFADHHLFTKSDAEAINTQFRMMKKPAIIVTTEKDATRLEHLKNLSDEVRAAMYVQPIKVTFMQDDEERFNNRIISYVRKNTKDSGMAEKANYQQPATRQADMPADDGDNTGYRPRTISF